MAIRDAFRDRIRALGVTPQDAEAQAAWLQSAESSVEALKEIYRSDEVILYASMPHVFIRTVLALKEKVADLDRRDLRNAYLSADGGWHIEHSHQGSDPDQIYLADPMSGSGKTLDGGERLVFVRTMEGSDNGSYLEMNQKVTQALDIHWLEERQAFCKYDDRGDLEVVVRFIDLGPVSDAYGTCKAVSIRASALSTYMVVTDTALVVKFDFTRFKLGDFRSWDSAERRMRSGANIEYETCSVEDHASFANGWMTSVPVLTRDDLIRKQQERWDPSAREYASFIIQDWRNKRVIDCSTAPEHSTNYFDAKLGLPFEVSPAFFKPQVLARYKADTDKYKMDHGSIRCRSAWELRSYSVNSEGQVHAYLIDLAKMPYEEQLYWKSFNEEPKAPISDRSFKNDFQGEFYTDYEPLDSLKRQVEHLNEQGSRWWIAREDSLMRTVHYPLSESVTEWSNELLNLDQATVEGLRKSEIQSLLRKRDLSFEANWGSLKLIELLLIANGEGESEAKALTGPLHELHTLRNVLRAHSSNQQRRQAERKAIKEHGSLGVHYKNLAERCDFSLRKISEFLTIL